MSWLSTSLSENLTNITGQISTFTKDMLAEGAVEIDDPETELKIAKARLRELELTLYTQREEYDRIKELNHELQERADAAELQISSISREYRTLLQDKENELAQLREQLEVHKEHIRSSQARERIPSFNEELFVSGSSHEEMQYLKAVISKLQDEKKEWTKNSDKENLHKELDHYQHELATLHSTYSQRIASLNKNHKEELRMIEEAQAEDVARITELEQELEKIRTHTFREDAQSSGKLNVEEIDSLKEALNHSEEKVKDLSRQLEELVENKAGVVEDVVVVKCDSEDVESVGATDSVFELVDKQSDEQELKQLIDQLEHEKGVLVEERDQAVAAEQQTSASLESLKEELSRLATVTMELMKELEQSQGVDTEKSIEIESLKKLCLARKDCGNKEEVSKLRDMMAALWKKYAAVVLDNEKVRLEMNNAKQRLLTQLQDRHGDTKNLIDGLGVVRRNLEGTLEGQIEQVHIERTKLQTILPEVGNHIEEREESVTRLQEENERTKKDTKDIVSDIGNFWATGDHVASLQAEKAVLERTIVGLEAKVEHLEGLLETRDYQDDDTPRSSVSTVISVGGLPSPQSPRTVQDDSPLEVLESRESGRDLEHGSGDDVSALMTKLKEYEATIEEFELIKEDWEGEKEALENVLMDLRKRLKDAIAKNDAEKNSVEENDEEKSSLDLGKEYLNEIQKLLVMRNYLDEKKVEVCANDSSRVDMVLAGTLRLLREGSEVEEPIVRRAEHEEWSSALETTPSAWDSEGLLVQSVDTDNEMAFNETANELKEGMNGLNATRTKLGETENEVDDTRTMLRKTENELDKTRTKLEETENEFGKTRTIFGEIENELSETRMKLEETKHELGETKTKLREAKNELGERSTKLGEMENELAEMKANLGETENVLAATKNVLEEMKNELSLTKVELEGANEERVKVASQVQFLESELEQSNRDVNSALAEKDKELHKLRYSVEELQGTLSNFENDKSNDIVGLTRNMEELRKELREAEISNDKLSAFGEEKTAQLQAVIDTNNSLGEDLVELRSEKDKLVGMVNERDSRIEELQDLYESANEHSSFLQDKGNESSRAFNELNEECSQLKDEKSELFSLLEEKDFELNNSLRENEKLSEVLKQHEMASEVMRNQNVELAEDLERWRVQMEELNRANETLNHELDSRTEEILSLKENNIELITQSYEQTRHDTEEISHKLSMMEELVSENSNLKSEKDVLMDALSVKESSVKELQDSYNLVVREKQQLETSLVQASESEKEARRLAQEVEVLRLEVGRLTREVQEKEATIRAAVSRSTVVSGDNEDEVARQQGHVRRILEEKDVEIGALRTKNESLLTVFAENEAQTMRVNGEHEHQIRSMLGQQERMLNEINEKTDQIVALEDKLEMLNIKAGSKDQATALMHAEHQKLLRLNESQSEEIGKLRDKVGTLGVLVAEKDHGIEHEAQHMHQRNRDLQNQVDALQGEQERLLTLVHELKERQLHGIVHEVPITRAVDTAVTNAAMPAGSSQVFDNGNDFRSGERVLTLEAEVVSLNEILERERGTSTITRNENATMTQKLRSLEHARSDDAEKMLNFERQLELVRSELAEKGREMEKNAREIHEKVYEIDTLRNEKDEMLLEHGAQNSELRRKLGAVLDVVSTEGGFNDVTIEGLLEDRQGFQRVLNKIRSHRAKILTDKENQLKLMKEQLQTLSSIQNIPNSELEGKLERFVSEKDEMNRKLLEIESEKLELLREKENELDALRTQIVDISNVLHQKEREWSQERKRFDQQNSLLDKQVKGLQQDKDTLLEVKAQMENEASQLRNDISTFALQRSVSEGVEVKGKERRVQELEQDLDGLKERYSRSLQEAQNLKASLDGAKEAAKGFEAKKEKQLERLRTHLLQVEESYTQEALASEEREKELRNQLERIQEQLLSSSHSLQNTNRTVSMKMDNLQEQLMSMTAHRDDLLAQLEQSQEQSLQAMRSVENLQMVLEQFQREKESELKSLREKNKEELKEAEKEVDRLRQREVELKKLLGNASDALNKADKLGSDLRSKEEEIETLKATVSSLEADLQSSHEKLRKLSSNSDGKIEKSLMKNMLLAYFNTAEPKRADVVAVLGHILSFSDEEIARVGSGSHPPQSSVGWFGGLLSYGSGSSDSHHHDKTFSELFVSFLEKESENDASTTIPPSPAPSSTRTVTPTVMAPDRVRAPPFVPSPLAASTPYTNARPALSNPLLINARMQEDGTTKDAAVKPVDGGNPLLGSTLRPSLDLPTITNSSSSASPLRHILFNNS